MSYTVSSDAHKLAHGDIYNNTQTGITDRVIALAFAMVNARLKSKGITPPASDDILAAAESFYIEAWMLMKGRIMGDLPNGGQGNISSQDNVNKSFKLLVDYGDIQVDNYIQFVTIGTDATVNIQPSDIAGVARSDVVGNNFKLHQNPIGIFKEV